MPPSAPLPDAAPQSDHTAYVTSATRGPAARQVHSPSRLRLLKYGWLSLGLLVLAEYFALPTSGPPDLIFLTLVSGFSVLATVWAILDTEEPATRPNPLVALRLDREACFPGGTLRGELDLRVACGARFRKIRLAVTGVVATQTIASVNGVNHGDAFVTTMFVPIFKSRPPLVALAEAPALLNGVRARAPLPPGHFTYAFAVAIPPTAPLSLAPQRAGLPPEGARYAVDFVARPRVLRPALRCRLNFLVVAPP